MQEFGRQRLMYQEEHVTDFFPSTEMEDTLSSASYLSIHVDPSNALENNAECTQNY